MLWILRRIYAVISAVVCVCLIGCMLWTSNLCKLKAIDGKRTFYLYSASSQATIVSTLHFSQIFSVKGESVRFSLDGANGADTAERILSLYGATLVYKEEISGTTSYYAISPRFSNHVNVGGQKINLHVSVNAQDCVVGNPIIFGGF